MITQNKKVQHLYKNNLLIIQKLKQLSHDYSLNEKAYGPYNQFSAYLQYKNAISTAFDLQTKSSEILDFPISEKSQTALSRHKPTQNFTDHKLHTNIKNTHLKSTKWLNYFFYNSPINLLFSIDEFLFQFAKKQPRRRKSSEFQQQLKQRKKLTIFYGHLSKKQLENLLSQSKSYQGYFSKNFFSIIECRLDVLLYRSGFVKNIITARQFISHKKVMVNNQIQYIASYQVKPGDIIKIISKNDKIVSPLSETIRAKFRTRGSRFTISENFIYKLQNRTSSKNYKQKKIIKNYIRLLLTKIDKRAHLKINKSSAKSQYFAIAKNFTLLKLKPLLSKTAQSFLYMYIQKNYLSFHRKPIFQDKYIGCVNLLERYATESWTLFAQRVSKESGVDLTSKLRNLNIQKNTYFNAKISNEKWNNKTSNFLQNKKQFNTISSSACSFFSQKKEDMLFFVKQKTNTLFAQRGLDFQSQASSAFLSFPELCSGKERNGKKYKYFAMSHKELTNGFLTRLLSTTAFLERAKNVQEALPTKKNSSIFTKKTPGFFSILKQNTLYRNIVYKTLLQMYFHFLYSHCSDTTQNINAIHCKSSQNKKLTNRQKHRINTLFTLKLKKHVTKKRSRKQIIKTLSICLIKPMHIEVSYSISTAILLYSPQRLNFPFYIDVDLILRSFR